MVTRMLWRCLPLAAAFLVSNAAAEPSNGATGAPPDPPAAAEPPTGATGAPPESSAALIPPRSSVCRAGAAARHGGPAIGLALSGGGARGLAHIGVLRALEEARVPVDCVAGTSMGAIVGSLYASGLSPDQIESAVLAIDWNDLFNDRPPRRDLRYRRKEDDASDLMKIEIGFRKGRFVLPRGLVAGQKISFALASMTLHAATVTDFDRLNIPFRTVATDLGSGRMIVLDRGNLAQAVRASMSVPGLLAPVEIDGRILADGGLVRNLPVDVVRSMGADIVIAVDVSTPLLPSEEMRSVQQYTFQTTTMLTRGNVESQLADADIGIVPDLTSMPSGGYGRAREVIARGREAARSHAGDLARHALTVPQYADHLGRVRAAPSPPPFLESVRVEGVTRADPRIAERRIETRAGAPLSVGTLRDDLARLYELGDFEWVDYDLREDAGKTGLVIRAREKSWGPDYVRFGVNFRNDFEGDTDFGVIGRLTATRLNPLGAEWRSDVELGETRRVSSEFYQPLDFSGVFFVAPSLDYADSIVGIYDNDDRIATYQVRAASATVALGAELGRFGEARIGVVRGRLRGRPDVGDTLLPILRIPTGAWAGRLEIDTLDDPNFPHLGRRGSLEVYLSRKALGSDVSYDWVRGSLLQVLHRGRHQVFYSAAGGTSLGSDIPFYDEFPIGGLFSFSGFKPGEIRGPVFGIASLGYYRRSGSLSEVFGRGTYLGGWIEAGNVWDSTRAAGLGDLHYAATLAVGVDTFFGPIYAAYGHAEGGHSAFYLTMGRSLGGRRRFGFGHY